MSNVQNGLYKFPWKRKTWKLQVTSWGLVKSTPDCGLWYITEDSFFAFPLWLLPSKPEHSERQTWGRVSSRCFLHGENICRKVVTKHVFWLLLETLLKGCLLPFTDEWVTERSFKCEKSQTFIFIFLLHNCMKLFSYSFLTAIFWIPYVHCNMKKWF